MNTKLQTQIEQAQAQANKARAEIDAQNSAHRNLSEAEAKLDALKIQAQEYEAQKEKRRGELAKLEKAQAKNISETLKLLDSAWDAALSEVIAVRDASRLDEDKDMPRRYTIFGGEHFGSIENMLTSIEVRETNIFNEAKIKSRVERYNLAMSKGIEVAHYPHYQ